MDTIGPLPRSEIGNEYADKSVIAILEHFILMYDPIKTFITDKKKEYTNSII